MCRCCSFDSLSCRRRTLKASGSFLIIFGFVFFLAGIAVGILPRVYSQLPDVYSTYIFFAFLVPATGMAAFVTGMGAIHMGRIMSDDDCSARGVSALALLTILCSLASVGVPAWPLYEEGYFLGIPPRTQTMDNTTADMTTALQMTTVLPAMATSESLVNSTASSTNMTQMSTSWNDTMATQNMTTVTANSTEVNSTQTVVISTAAPDNATRTSGQNDTAPSTVVPITSTAMGGTNEPTMTANTTEQTTAATREPIPFDQWFDVILPFGIICVFALIFVLCAMLVCCIGCCCADYSEIVDDNEIYKR